MRTFTRHVGISGLAAAVGASFLAAGSAVFAADDPPKPAPAPKQDAEPQGDGLEQLRGQFDRFRESFGLTPEQMEKLQGLGEGLRETIMEGVRRYQEEGPPSQEDLQKELGALRERIQGDLDGVLTEEQRNKLRDMMQNPENVPQLREGLARARDVGIDARLKQIENALLLSAEEAEALMPVVKRVLIAQAERDRIATEGRAELTTLLKSGAAGDAVKGRLTDIRTATANAEKSVTTAQAELRELVTLEQEAKLVAFGVLP